MFHHGDFHDLNFFSLKLLNTSLFISHFSPQFEEDYCVFCSFHIDIEFSYGENFNSSYIIEASKQQALAYFYINCKVLRKGTQSTSSVLSSMLNTNSNMISCADDEKSSLRYYWILVKSWYLSTVICLHSSKNCVHA